MKLGSGCYYFSRDRMGWIEAKKTCELMTEGGRLVHIETPAERDLLLKQVAKQSRSRFEYWTAGNDIDEENRWVWAGGEAEKVRTRSFFRSNRSNMKYSSRPSYQRNRPQRQKQK